MTTARRWAARVLTVLLLAVLAGLVAGPAQAAPGGCAVAPEPDRPGSGLVGMLDPSPAGGAGSVYAEVGYAGTTWRTYDLCSRPDATTAATDTWVGSQLFDVAKTIVAGANGLSHQLATGGSLDGLDTLLHDGVGAMYRTVFTTWIGPALLALAVILLVMAARGDLAAQANRGLAALAALVLGSLVYAAPVSLLKVSDDVLLDGIAQMQQGFLTDLGAADRTSLADTLTDQIVYRNWLRGEFGSDAAPQARDLGRNLLRAQTFTLAEVAGHQDTPATAARKKQEFTAITGKLGDRYAQFQGVAGSRVGTGGIALVQSLALAAFPAVSSLVVFVALIVLRLLVLFAPLVAVLAVLRPQVLLAVFRLGAGVAVNAVVAGVLAAAHAWLVVAMLAPGSAVDPVLALVVASVVSVLFWVLVRPVRRLMTIGSMVLPPRPLPAFTAEPAAAGRASPAVVEPVRLPPTVARPALTRPVPARAALPAGGPDRSPHEQIEVLHGRDAAPPSDAVPGARRGRTGAAGGAAGRGHERDRAAGS